MCMFVESDVEQINLIMLPVTGILIGTLTMELGGKVTIECEKTGYKTDLEFKLKVRIAASWLFVSAMYGVFLPYVCISTISLYLLGVKLYSLGFCVW